MINVLSENHHMKEEVKGKEDTGHVPRRKWLCPSAVLQGSAFPVIACIFLTGLWV